jgi:hypothetical protein
VAVKAAGIPLAALAAPANHRYDGLLAATWTPWVRSARCPPSQSYTWTPATTTSRVGQVLTKHGMVGQIATRGMPAPIQVGRRWMIERTHAWANQYGKLRWCTERRQLVVVFWLALAGAVIVLGRLVRRAWVSYRWEGRPRRRP